MLTILTGDKGPSITTYTGREFPLLEATVDDINIRDIAHALSNTCRYAGHCALFYSVAEHSCRLSFLVPEQLRLEALLHDASEAYLGDIPTPLKKLLPRYRKIERRINEVIMLKYDLRRSTLVRKYDKLICTPEVTSLLVNGHPGWELEPFQHQDIIPWPGRVAEEWFLQFFERYTSGMA